MCGWIAREEPFEAASLDLPDEHFDVESLKELRCPRGKASFCAHHHGPKVLLGLALAQPKQFYAFVMVSLHPTYRPAIESFNVGDGIVFEVEVM